MVTNFKDFNTKLDEAAKKTKGAKLPFSALDGGDVFYDTEFGGIAGRVKIIKFLRPLKHKNGGYVNAMILETGEPMSFGDDETVVFVSKGKG